MAVTCPPRAACPLSFLRGGGEEEARPNPHLAPDLGRPARCSLLSLSLSQVPTSGPWPLLFLMLGMPLPQS